MKKKFNKHLVVKGHERIHRKPSSLGPVPSEQVAVPQAHCGGSRWRWLGINRNHEFRYCTEIQGNETKSRMEKSKLNPHEDV